MKQRNIHGKWTMRFENRLLHSEVFGATNAEASLGWFKDLQEHIQRSPEQDSTPWVILHDCREWVGASEDAWEMNNKITDWVTEHNCILEAVVLGGKVQLYVAEKELPGQNVLHYYFDYDEAYQACLDKLAASQGHQ